MRLQDEQSEVYHKGDSAYLKEDGRQIMTMTIAPMREGQERARSSTGSPCKMTNVSKLYVIS